MSSPNSRRNSCTPGREPATRPMREAQAHLINPLVGDVEQRADHGHRRQRALRGQPGFGPMPRKTRRASSPAAATASRAAPSSASTSARGRRTTHALTPASASSTSPGSDSATSATTAVRPGGTARARCSSATSSRRRLGQRTRQRREGVAEQERVERPFLLPVRAAVIVLPLSTARPRAPWVRARCEHAPAYPAHVRRARGRSHAVPGGPAARPAEW